jgi:hypothetical protein
MNLPSLKDLYTLFLITEFGGNDSLDTLIDN